MSHAARVAPPRPAARKLGPDDLPAWLRAVALTYALKRTGKLLLLLLSCFDWDNWGDGARPSLAALARLLPANLKTVKRALPHDLRRSAVRDLERGGVSRSVAMALVGHRTQSMYEPYAIVAEADQREGARKLAALRAKDATTANQVLAFPKTGTHS